MITIERALNIFLTQDNESARSLIKLERSIGNNLKISLTGGKDSQSVTINRDEILAIMNGETHE